MYKKPIKTFPLFDTHPQPDNTFTWSRDFIINFQKHSIENSFFLCDKILYSYCFHNTYVVEMYICNISINNHFHWRRIYAHRQTNTSGQRRRFFLFCFSFQFCMTLKSTYVWKHSWYKKNSWYKKKKRVGPSSRGACLH